nr:hypothetical protein [Deinococcus sp. 6YEL10]
MGGDGVGVVGVEGDGVGGELLAGEAGEFEGWGAVAGEEAVGGVGGDVAGWAVVEQEGAAAGAAEDEGGVESGAAGADDEDLE